MDSFDYLIVGAGFSGSTVAERLASQKSKKVLIVDSRPHVGGNAYDFIDEYGLRIHRYGPHIFHTNSDRVFNYLSLFTEWMPYEHRVQAHVDGRNVPIPINLDTINQLYGTQYDSFSLTKYFNSVRSEIEIKNSRDVVVAKVGEELYEKFFKNYTYKQWGIAAESLDPSVCARIPIRVNRDSRYFTDKYQYMPMRGYAHLFERMLSNPNIFVMLGVSFDEISKYVQYKHLVYTGPVDQYFSYRLGRLPYRSLNFRYEYHDKEYFFRNGTVNYPNDYEFTRITEMKYLTGQHNPKTVLVYEYPTGDGEPFYPMPTTESRELYQRYYQMAQGEPGVTFLGRLGTYKYYNMDQVVAQALTAVSSMD